MKFLEVDFDYVDLSRPVNTLKRWVNVQAKISYFDFQAAMFRQMQKDMTALLYSNELSLSTVYQYNYTLWGTKSN